MKKILGKIKDSGKNSKAKGEKVAKKIKEKIRKDKLGFIINIGIILIVPIPAIPIAYIAIKKIRSKKPASKESEIDSSFFILNISI